MNNMMIDLHENHCIDDQGNIEYCQMYFGSLNGIYRQFPGVPSIPNKDGSFPNYDPRLRPWFMAAAAGEHIIVFLLDISDSMNQNSRITKMKSALKSQLNLLPSSTWLTIIAFNDDILLPCFRMSVCL